MNKSQKNKLIITATSVIAVAVGIAVISKVIKKRRWEGRDRDRDHEYNPNTEIRLAYVGEQGSTNIRKTPEVTSKYAQVTNASWWIGVLTLNPASQTQATIESSNLIGTATSGLIGEIVADQKGVDGFRWYKVALVQPLSGQTVGWVREDVTMVKIEKK